MKISNEQIEEWAQKETKEHFKKYWQNEDGTKIPSADITSAALANYLVEMSTYQFGLIKGAISYRDNLIY